MSLKIMLKNKARVRSKRVIFIVFCIILSFCFMFNISKILQIKQTHASL